MVEIRSAEVADAAAVMQIRVRSWQDAYAGIVPDDVLAALDDDLPARISQAEAGWASSTPRRFTTLVAEADGQVTGFVTFGEYRLSGDGGPTEPGVGEIVLIYVDPPRTGRGAGRRLMDAAVAALRSAGAGEIRLWVLAENAPARRFYERYGYLADGAQHVFTVERPGGTRVDLPEVRYTLPAA